MKLSFDFADYSIYENSKKHYSSASNILEGLQLGQPATYPIDWYNFPNRFGEAIQEQFSALKKKITRPYDLVITVGIGGSYLGSRTIYQMLRGTFDDLLNSALAATRPQQVPIVFAGTNLAGSTHQDLLELLKAYNPIVVMVSKSGETIEPAMAFRTLRQAMLEKYGQAETSRRIVTVTDPNQGTLRQMTKQCGWLSADIPSGIGGRFSIFSAAGLLPLYLAGYELHALLHGAQDMFNSFKNAERNAPHPAVQYAAYRYAAYEAGKKIEVICSFEARASSLLDWYQQLYGESLGKENRGLFIAPLRYSTDLHSMGQYMQEGERLMTQTVLLFDQIKHSAAPLTVPEESQEFGDGLGYLVGEDWNKLNADACLATMAAHKEGGVGSVLIRSTQLSMQTLGGLLAFFQTACAVEGLMQGLNPFDQPGVEAYKKNMFALFGKPGTDELGKNLRASISKS